MYCALADSKLLCRLSDCGIFLDDIVRNFNCPFLYIIFQGYSPHTLFLHLMQDAKSVFKENASGSPGSLRPYSSTSKGSRARISFSMSTPGYTSISFSPFGVSRNTQRSVT